MGLLLPPRLPCGDLLSPPLLFQATAQVSFVSTSRPRLCLADIEPHAAEDPLHPLSAGLY